MITHNLIQYKTTEENLFFWITNYIASKLYSINATREKREEFIKKREEFYNLILNSNDIKELDKNSKEVIRHGLNGLRVYITPLIPFYEIVEKNKQIKKLTTIKDIDTNYINSYASLKFEKLKDDTRRTYYNQLRSLFKFIDIKSKDEHDFKFNIGFLKDNTKVKAPIKNKIGKKFRYLEPIIFEKFIESIKTYKSKRIDVNNQRLMVKFFCFAGLRSIETRSIKKSDCSVKEINGIDYLQVHIVGKGDYLRHIFIKYSYIKDDYERTLELNNHCEYLFYTRDNKQYEEKTVYTLIDRFYKHSKIDSKNLGIRALRASWATYLHSKGVKLQVVIDLLGHIDPEVQNLYIYEDKEKIKELPKLFENL